MIQRISDLCIDTTKPRTGTESRTTDAVTVNHVPTVSVALALYIFNPVLPFSCPKVLPHIVDNIGFVFTKGDLVDVRDKLLSNKKPASAKAGALAPIDVFVPAMNTGLGPEKTSFFQVNWICRLNAADYRMLIDRIQDSLYSTEPMILQ